jgi:hypothetical protein
MYPHYETVSFDKLRKGEKEYCISSNSAYNTGLHVNLFKKIHCCKANEKQTYVHHIA